MDIYGLKKNLIGAENKIRNSSISGQNKKIIFDYEKQLFMFGTPRIERSISILRIISEKLNKQLDSLEKEDIETFLEWLQRKEIEDWTKYTYKQIQTHIPNSLIALLMLQTSIIFSVYLSKL